MNFLQILQLILQLVPAGVQLTQEILTLIQAIEAAFSGTLVPAEKQKAVVTALAAHLAKAA